MSLLQLVNWIVGVMKKAGLNLEIGWELLPAIESEARSRGLSLEVYCIEGILAALHNAIAERDSRELSARTLATKEASLAEIEVSRGIFAEAQSGIMRKQARGHDRRREFLEVCTRNPHWSSADRLKAARKMKVAP